MISCLPVGLAAQTAEEEPAPEEILNKYARSLPDHLLVEPYHNEFSVSLRLLGNAKVQFSNLGLIRTDFDEDDATTLSNRVYADGYVGFDQRGETSNSFNLSDGATNNWSYADEGQVTADGTGVMFHAYASSPNDSVVEAESGKAVNPDLEYSRVLWQGGRWAGPRRRAWQVGWLGGWGLSDVNAKFRGTTTADLVITTDTYSLLGAPAPTIEYDDDGVSLGYTSPSYQTVELVGEDGITTTYVVEDSTLLGNLPQDRTVQTISDGAEIEGFWQVHGAYFTLRSGPWMRWEPINNISLKVSGGGTFTLIGLSMRYAETLIIDADTQSDEISEQSDTQTETFAGVFGSVDAEWMLNDRTSFFASAYYEDFDEELSLEIDGREAAAEISSGLGLRIGITTKF
ncbi:hypothetical protein [Synoicihabitans lomoniglobus]|uniref:hypothetical protein n=1 Tax=Synoicihabitans lomoniglobus TaxID=2909285 RepID=UPI002ED69684|nr:hypothetical protein [Opitutaceae bacterium LMO-M01]